MYLKSLSSMKFIFTVVSFAILTFSGNAQSSSYLNIKKIITETHPEINTENKLIAFNVWSISNQESREANKQFEKVYSVYESALLTGGSKGVIVISINTDNLSSNALIVYTKDGLSKLLPFKWSDFENLDSTTSNAVFDSSGKEVYKNLSTQSVFNSFHQLVTR